MECDPSHEDGTRPERAGGSASPVAQQADPRGFHERTFLGQSNAAEAEPELEEKDIGPEFDSYEDLAGDKLRLLDSFSIYYEDGRPAPPKALDSAKERGETFVAFGTLVAPLTDDARMKLVSLDVRLKGRVPPCLPKSLDGGSPEPLPWVPVAASAAVTPRGGAGGSGKKPKPKAKGGKPPLGGNEEGAAGPWGGAAMEGSDA